MAISSITASQANAVLHAQTVKKPSETRANNTVQSVRSDVNKTADTVTISRLAQRSAVQAENANSLLQTDQKNSAAEVKNNVVESSDKRSAEKLTIFEQVQKAALQAAVKTAIDTRDAAAAKAAKATQAATDAKAAATEQKENMAKAAEAAQAIAAAQNANAALAIAAAQATNAARNASSN